MDWNSRHPLCGDKLENKYGRLLADYCADSSLSIISPHQPTFVPANKKASSIIDFCITEQKCSDLVCNAPVIKDIEFFSGAPEQNHWPVLFDIDIPVKYNNPKRCVLSYKMTNWEEISIQLEKIMVENMVSMITEAPTKSLLTFMGPVRGVCENSIPRKTLCKYSKPYWSKKLTHLPNKLKEARKKYRLQCNPKNKNIVEMARIESQKDMKKNNTRWTQNGIMQMNEGNSETFYDNIPKYNGSMDLNNIGLLRHQGKALEKDCHKAALFNVFSSMAHTLLVNYLTTHFMENKSRSEREVGSRRWGLLQGGGQE